MLRSVIAKLENAENSMNVIISCNKCLEIMKDPITCIPCGHHYCKKCTAGYENDTCYECKDYIDHLFQNEVLSKICAKSNYRKAIFNAVSS